MRLPQGHGGRSPDRPSGSGQGWRSPMLTYLLAVLIGVVAGLRAMSVPAAVSWASHLGWLNFDGTWLAFLGFWVTPYIITVAALAELVTDQLPGTPSRKVPMQFG